MQIIHSAIAEQMVIYDRNLRFLSGGSGAGTDYEVAHIEYAHRQVHFVAMGTRSEMTSLQWLTSEALGHHILRARS